jgi:26S proteasome regulatory subunit N2
MGGATGLSSASGIIALLDEDQQELKEIALTRLNEVVHEFWAEIAVSISKMYVFHFGFFR